MVKREESGKWSMKYTAQSVKNYVWGERKSEKHGKWINGMVSRVCDIKNGLWRAKYDASG